jgi:hypothetical protein
VITECPFDAQLILGNDPFAGDFGDGERVLSDKVGRVRKPFVCQCCSDQGQPGEWARIRTEVGGDGIATYRWCTLCCQAEARIDFDGGDAIGAREAIGYAIRSGTPDAEVAGLRTEAAVVLAASFQAEEDAKS